MPSWILKQILKQRSCVAGPEHTTSRAGIAGTFLAGTLKYAADASD
jgi:hypothetical protein